MPTETIAPPKIITFERPDQESEIFYTRRLQDPLEVATANPERRVTLVNEAEEGIRVSSEAGNFHEAIEFTADYAYRSLGVLPYEDTAKATQTGSTLILEAIGDRGRILPPAKRLGLAMRLLDLGSLQSFAKYQKNRYQRTGAETRNADKQLEASLFSVIKTGAEWLKDYQQQHELLTDDTAKQDLRGKMFELLFVTYSRLQIYGDERYDDALVVGATEFEDRSAKEFIPYSHNYDVLFLGARGRAMRLVQCKSNLQTKAYQPPIEKVTGEAFGRFVNRPKSYIDALTQLVGNSAEVSEAQMRRNKEILDSLFMGGTNRVPSYVGNAALVGALH